MFSRRDISAGGFRSVLFLEWKRENISLTLSLLTGELYTFSKLEYGTEPFIGEVTAALQSLLERSLVQLQEMDKTHTGGDGSKVDAGSSERCDRKTFRRSTCTGDRTREADQRE